MLLLLFLPLFSFAGHLLSFISMGEVLGKVSNSQSQKTVNTWNIFSNMLWPVMHCPAPSLPSHPKFPRQLHMISQGKVMHSYSDNRNLDVTTHSMVIQFTKKLCYIVYRVCTGSWILEKKVLKLAQQFSRPRKSLENGYRVYKNGKSLFLIFFFKATTSVILQQVLYESYFFCFDQILLNLARTSTFAAHHEKSFVPAFFKVSIDHLFDNLESGKRNNKLFGKKVWKKP